MSSRSIAVNLPTNLVEKPTRRLDDQMCRDHTPDLRTTSSDPFFVLLVGGLDDPVGGGRNICRTTKSAGIARDGAVGITRGGDPARGSISISETELHTSTWKDGGREGGQYKYSQSQDLLAAAAASLPLVFSKPAIVMSKPLNGAMFARRLHVRHPLLCLEGAM